MVKGWAASGLNAQVGDEDAVRGGGQAAVHEANDKVLQQVAAPMRRPNVHRAGVVQRTLRG